MTVEERVTLLETRMTALEQLPARMDRLDSRIDRLESELRAEVRVGDEETRRVLRLEVREGNVMTVTVLTEQIEESRRYARVLHEEAVGRIGLLGEAFAALSGAFTAVRGEFGAAQRENRATLDLILARLESPKLTRKSKRGDEKA